MENDLTSEYEAGIALLRDGKPREARAKLERFLGGPEGDVMRREHARMLVGYACGQLDDWESAAEAFRLAMTNDIECLPAYTALGHAYLMLERIPDAVETFRMAVQKEPKNPQARHGLGWALLQQGEDLDEALYQAQEALRLNPQSAAIRDTVGWALYRHGDLEAAAEQLEEAIRLDPDHPAILAHWREVRDKARAKNPIPGENREQRRRREE